MRLDFSVASHHSSKLQHSSTPILLPNHSDSQYVEHDGKKTAGNYDGDNSRDHGGSRRIAHRRGAVAALNPPQTTRKRDQHAVNRALEYAAKHVRQADGIGGLAKIGGPGKIEHADTDGGAAEDADEVGVKTKQRHHQHERDHPRQHKNSSGEKPMVVKASIS